jgi:hypothetical protein
MEQFENFEKPQHNAGLGWSRENVSVIHGENLGKRKFVKICQEYPCLG